METRECFQSGRLAGWVDVGEGGVVSMCRMRDIRRKGGQAGTVGWTRGGQLARCVETERDWRREDGTDGMSCAGARSRTRANERVESGEARVEGR